MGLRMNLVDLQLPQIIELDWNNEILIKFNFI